MTTLLSFVLALQSGPLTAEETRDFMKKLIATVETNHLKRDPKSEQRGMTYEYCDVTRKGQPDQWVQGEALDTMLDGAWLGIALVEAARATNDPAYKDFLTQWTLPFYCRMLNHSDTLFSAKQDDVAPKGHKFGKEHQLQEGEKGFVPYWWDEALLTFLELVLLAELVTFGRDVVLLRAEERVGVVEHPAVEGERPLREEVLVRRIVRGAGGLDERNAEPRAVEHRVERLALDPLVGLPLAGD